MKLFSGNWENNEVVWDSIGEQIVDFEVIEEVIVPLYDNVFEDKLYYTTEIVAKPIEGMKSFLKKVTQELDKYRGDKHKIINGRIYLNFVVEKNGKVYGYNIKKGLDPDFDKFVAFLF